MLIFLWWIKCIDQKMVCGLATVDKCCWCDSWMSEWCQQLQSTGTQGTNILDTPKTKQTLHTLCIELLIVQILSGNCLIGFGECAILVLQNHKQSFAAYCVIYVFNIYDLSCGLGTSHLALHHVNLKKRLQLASKSVGQSLTFVLSRSWFLKMRIGQDYYMIDDLEHCLKTQHNIP